MTVVAFDQKVRMVGDALITTGLGIAILVFSASIMNHEVTSTLISQNLIFQNPDRDPLQTENTPPHPETPTRTETPIHGSKNITLP